MEKVGLYIHIPFCLSKCGYCDFYSVTDTALFGAYAAELKKELKAAADGFDGVIDTVYLGGGTPSAMPVRLLEDIADAVYKSFNCGVAEFSIEVNPCICGDLSRYKNFGVNRISLGVQSLDDGILRMLGRRHTAAQAAFAVESAAKSFDNVSADLIIGVASGEDAIKDIDAVKAYVKHFSVYILKLESGTPLAAAAASGAYIPLDDDTAAEKYDAVYKKLAESGFSRYEISNFCLDGYACRHNLKYWRMQPYIGAGPAAHSYYKGKRYRNPASLKEYLNGVHSGGGGAVPEPANPLEETLMLGLRLEEGLDIALFDRTFGTDFYKDYAAPLKKLTPYLAAQNGRLAIKPEYMLLQNSVAAEFV